MEFTKGLTRSVSFGTPSSHGVHGRCSSVDVQVPISCEFDSGNIEVLDASSPYERGIELRVRPDKYTELEKKAHVQWFHFKASAVRNGCKFAIVNAGECSYPDAWPGYTVAYSKDRVEWGRCLSTTYSEGVLRWEWETGQSESEDTVYFAFFAPYSWERHMDLVGRAAASGRCRARVIGRTLDGNDLDMLVFGTGATKVWAIHRQHPGEPQAEWYAEGLVERLLDRDDPVARALCATCTFYIIPNMCPDGSIRGHLRTNGCGANLNREWQSTGSYAAPSPERSPEVLAALREMDAVGVDLFVDVHGDEEIPMNFVSGMEGLDSWGPRLQALQGAFCAAYQRANPEFQTAVSYEPEPPKGSNLAMCSNQVAHRFQCCGLTLEQPFKDNATMPDPQRGWTPSKCKKLGASFLDVVTHIQPYLRAEGAFWDTMDPRDAYVRPTEGSAQTTLPSRAAGTTYDTALEVQQMDQDLASAERQIAKLRVQRAKFVSQAPAARE